MANIKSAKKRILVNRTKAERNKSIRSAVKTAIKKVEVAVVNKDKETAVMHWVLLQLSSTKLHRKAFITKTTLLEKFLV